MDSAAQSPSAALTPDSAAAAVGGRKMDKIIVAIHGIGSQLRSDTIRSVARQFGNRSCPPLPVMPLGYFSLGKGATEQSTTEKTGTTEKIAEKTGEIRLSRLDVEQKHELASIGFAEVYWADIPGQVVKANDTLEETKAWGQTVVSRAEATYRKVPKGKLNREDFQLGISVVEEIVETVHVLDNLLAVTAKAGLFKFELAPLLRDYIGDVQIVTDFESHREEILFRFHDALGQIVKAFKKEHEGIDKDHTPEIYIVAHSEGTVISFLGLLQALSGQRVVDPKNATAEPVDCSWIQYVRGYMTIGSPIDKHIVLWPSLWKGLKLKSKLNLKSVEFDATGGARLNLKQQIKWRNYYDFGDPIGFKLDSARKWLKEEKCVAFEFDTDGHDFGFSRYWLPGKAHNDYWKDAEVFGHFIEDVVIPEAGVAARPPKNYKFVGFVSTLIPYVLTFLVHLAAVFLLYKGVTQAPDGQPPAQFDRLPLQLALLTGLLMSITAAARLPRLVKPDSFRWQLLALLIFLVGVGCVFALPTGPAEFLGAPLEWLVSFISLPDELAGKAAITTAAFLIVMTGWASKRKQRRGRRWLVGVGSFIIAFVVIAHLNGSDSEVPAWPLFLAGLAFLYLWWLGILMFDLTFVWHRYIRQSVAVDTLAQWRQGKDAVARSKMGFGS